MPEFTPNRIFLEKNKDFDYNFDLIIKPSVKPYKVEIINGFEVEIYKKEDYELVKKANGSYKEYNIRGSLITQKGSASEFYELFLREKKEGDGKGALYKVLKMGEKGDGLGYRYIRQPFDNGSNGVYYQGKPTKAGNDKGNPYPNYYDFEKDFNNCANEGGIIFKNGKKPENFLKKIFEIANISEKDIFLDFHLGSGSSCAIAHKLGIQYIGIEQMDNQVNLSKTRLQNVINNDQTGISKSVNWQGGGSFVYLELAKNNQNAIEHIQSCESYEALVDYFDVMRDKYFLHYNVKVNEFREIICKEENFKKLTLDQQKIMFAKMLDLNQLYVNVSDMEDSRYALSTTDIAVTKDFYQL
jgi:adenine-specific DNA-methyltransferase